MILKSNFICQGILGKELTVYGKGNQTRCFCFIDDLIEGLNKLMFSQYAKPVNLGSQKELSIIDLAKRKGIKVEERPIKVEEIKLAHQEGTLREVFGTGTAVIVLPINSFSHQNKTYNLPSKNTLAKSLKKLLMDIQYNESDDYFNWRKAVV